MRKLIHIDEINEKLRDYPFLDTPIGYWNVSKDGYNGFEQTAIEDMSEKHKNNCINMIQKQFIPKCKDDRILQLLNTKIKELQEY